MRNAIFRSLALLLVLSFGTQAFSAELSGSAQFVNNLGQKVIDMLANKNFTAKQREAEFSTMFKTNFDVPVISKFALGRHWREATPAEQQTYSQDFETMIVRVYNQRFSDYAGQTFNVTGSKPLETAGDELVRSNIAQQDGPPVAIDWRVRNKNGNYKIIDVIVEGVSMSITQRNEFDSIIQANGGQVAGLLKEMKSRINNPTAAAVKN